MQYVLTESEYIHLTTTRKYELRIASEKLQVLCTKIANEMPVSRSWSPHIPPFPWGCILNKPNDTGYCDECPVSEICPYDNKQWSK